MSLDQELLVFRLYRRQERTRRNTKDITVKRLSFLRSLLLRNLNATFRQPIGFNREEHEVTRRGLGNVGAVLERDERGGIATWNAELQLGPAPEHFTGANEGNQVGRDNVGGVIHPDSLGGDRA